jgi:sugar/nucleoside kinase (ribokinase family)
VLLARDADVSTGCVVVVGGTSIVADPGASIRLVPEDLPATLEAGAVLISGYTLLQPGPGAAALAALQRARTDWLAVDAASANLVAAFGVKRFFEATATAGVLFANAEEARALTGLDAAAAALALARRYRVVCVKLGRSGAVATTGGEIVRVEVQPVDRADTLGAGDAFAGGFLVSMSRGAELAVALRAGCDSAMSALLERD